MKKLFSFLTIFAFVSAVFLVPEAGALERIPHRNFDRTPTAWGEYGGHLRRPFQRNVRFVGRTIDPYKNYPTLDGVEINVPRMVSAVQQRLAARGVYRGAVDGQMNPAFVQALRKFQVEGSGRSTGVIDPGTLADVGLTASQFAR